LTLTIGCVIESITDFTVPAADSDRTYNLYDTVFELDMAKTHADNMKQTPACDYDLTPTYAFTIAANDQPFIKVDGVTTS